MNLNKILSRSLLAVALGACGAAFAGPTYHVTIDTSTLGSGSAILDLELGALSPTAAPVTATLNGFNVNAAYGASDFGGDAGGTLAGGVSLVNDAGYSDLFQTVTLGGLFSFDVSFDVAAGGADGTSFTAMLYAPDYSAALGMDTPLAEIDLSPGQDDVLSPANAFAAVAAVAGEVPEPSTLLSTMTGLGLLGFGLRRRQR